MFCSSRPQISLVETYHQLDFINNPDTFLHTENLHNPQQTPRHTQIWNFFCILKLAEYQSFANGYIPNTKNFAHKRQPMTAQEAAFQIMKHTYSRSHSQPFASPDAIQCPFMPIFLSFVLPFFALSLLFFRILPSAKKYHIILFLSHHDIILAKRPCTFL